jgi:hypothetical protein
MESAGGVIRVLPHRDGLRCETMIALRNRYVRRFIFEAVDRIQLQPRGNGISSAPGADLSRKKERQRRT